MPPPERGREGWEGGREGVHLTPGLLGLGVLFTYNNIMIRLCHAGPKFDLSAYY